VGDQIKTMTEIVPRDLAMNTSMRIWSLVELNDNVWSNVANFVKWDKILLYDNIIF